MNAITDESLMETLRAVVAEAPDTVYAPPDHMGSGDACYYVHADWDGGNVRPGCVIAHVLNRLGVSLETLALHEGESASAIMSALRIGSWDMRRRFRAVQYAQDQREPWADALARVERQTTV